MRSRCGADAEPMRSRADTAQALGQLCGAKMGSPLAYHITFGTYGTRLHGDSRGTVDRSANNPGDPIIGSDPDRWEFERSRLRFKPVELTPAQRQLIELVLPSVCERGGWQLHIGSAKKDHCHILLTSERDGEAVRKWIKRWLGEQLSPRVAIAPGGNLVGRMRQREVDLERRVFQQRVWLRETAACDAGMTTPTERTEPGRVGPFSGRTPQLEKSGRHSMLRKSGRHARLCV